MAGPGAGRRSAVGALVATAGVLASVAGCSNAPEPRPAAAAPGASVEPIAAPSTTSSLPAVATSTTPAPPTAPSTTSSLPPTTTSAPPTSIPAPPTSIPIPPTSIPAPPLPPPPRDVVAPAAPTSFQLSGQAFTITADVCGMPDVRPLDPPGDQRHTVCWVQDSFGVAPGSSSGGTSYILGHSWSQAQLVLNPLSELAMTQVDTSRPEVQSGVPTYPVTALNGYTVVLDTPTGTLTYAVTRAFAVPKELAGDVESLMANTPDRVVIITCAVNGGVDADYNIVVDAYLTSSLAA